MSLKRIYRIEFDDLNSPIPQALKKGSGIGVAPHAVINEIDLNTFRLFFQQQVRKLAAHVIGIDDKGFKVDMVFGALYGFEHCGIGGLAIGEESNFVSLRQRAFGQRFDYVIKTLQCVRRLSGSLQSFHDGFALFWR